MSSVSPTYNPDTSSTADDDDEDLLLEYDSGSGYGTLYSDVVRINTAVASGVPSAKFVVIEQAEEDFFEENAFQGILGLAYRRLAVGLIRPFFDYLVQQAGMSNLFAIQFCQDSGQLWLGGYDRRYYVGRLAYSPPITQPLYYAVTVTNISVNGVPLGVPMSALSPAQSVAQQPIIDTGVTLLYLNDAAFSAFSETMQRMFPTLNEDWITERHCIGDAAYSPASLNLSLTVYLSAPGSPAGVYPLTIPASQLVSSQECGYQLNVASDDRIVLGTAALVGQYVVFDRVRGRVGFAPGNASMCGVQDQSTIPQRIYGASARRLPV